MPRAKLPPLTAAEEARRAALLTRKKELEQAEAELLANARERAKKEQAKASKRERKADTFRKVLVGIAVLDEAEKNPVYKAALLGLLSRFFTSERERAALEVLGVPPLPRPAVAAQESETPSDTPPAEIAAVAARGFGEGVRMVRH
jgi:hypothetical protein